MNIQLTDNDYAFMNGIGLFGLMSTADALLQYYNAVTLPQIKYYQRRLRQLKEHGLIELHRITYNSDRGPRRHPNIVRLTPKGADEVEAAFGERPPRPARSDPPTIVTLLHRDGVTRFLLHCKNACEHEGLNDLRFILEQDTYPQLKPNAKRHEQFILYERFATSPDGRTIACRADAALRIDLPDTTVLIGYLEYDRSTDKRSQIVHKAISYRYLLDPKTRPYRRHWPDVIKPIPSVLFISKSTERTENVCSWIRGIDGSQYFRFAVDSDDPLAKAEHDLVPKKLDKHLLRAPIWSKVNPAQGSDPVVTGCSIIPS